MREPGHADRYTNLEVAYINHHNPDLILFDREGAEIQRIDLAPIILQVT